MIEIFTTLGRRLATFATDTATEPIIERAMADNAWFTREDICYAVEAIRHKMLDTKTLEAWLGQYPIANTPRRVALIMAGNIPLVGFFDLMCVVLSGHKCYVKPSSKDRVLMHYIIDLLRDIDPEIAIYDNSADEEYDMLIATGSDTTVEHFNTHYPTTRRLLRGSRHSIAVLDGSESEEELSALTRDITRHSGLGCRSVSMLFVPRGYEPHLECADHISPKRRRNLLTECALRNMQNAEYTNCGGFILERSSHFPTTLSSVSLVEYDTKAEVEGWIKEHGSELQCVVSHVDSLNRWLPFGRIIAFGEAQRPALDDYADGIDTMAWLTE